MENKWRATLALRTTAAEFLSWQSHFTDVFGHNISGVDHELSWLLYFNDTDGNPYEITSYEYQQIAGTLTV